MSDPKPHVILIIDDNPVNIKVIIEYLEAFDYELIVARTGKRGVKRAAFSKPDLILLDVLMPDMDGFETCKQLKADQSTREIPVIFMTALTDTRNKVKGFTVGGVDYITKPVQPEEVLARVNTHLSLRHLRKKTLEQNDQLQKEISERKNAEAALQQAHDLLEQRIKERTAELSETNAVLEKEIIHRDAAEKALKKKERELRQAHKMEAMGTLAGGIAHDFNNILSAIIGYTELSLEEIPRKNKVHDNLRQVLRAGHRAGELVHQILTFSRQADPKMKHVDIETIIDEALTLLRASMPATIRIDKRIHSRTRIFADPTQIYQVIMNLCTNSGYAMKEKGGILTIQVTDISSEKALSQDFSEMVPGTYLKLTVSDTGHGMPSAVLERIFDPFFTTKKAGDGTGMGLAVVYGIVRSLNGKIRVDSTPGKGTVFEILFPTVVAARRRPSSAPGGPLPTGRERILFVDDEQVLVDVGQEMLSRLGYRVTAQVGSAAALKLFYTRPQEFDLLVTDLTMPEMSGIELARRVAEVRPDVPSVICTGYESLEVEEQLSRGMIKAVIQKPMNMNELAQTVRQVLETTRKEQQINLDQIK